MPMWKKLRRNLFSGFFLFILILLIEVLVILFLQFFMDDILLDLLPDVNVQIIVTLIWLGVRVIGWVFAVILFFKIINKQEDPEFKIAWVVGIFLVPIFVIFMYLIFGNHGLSIREKRVVDVSRSSYIPYLQRQHKAFKDNDKDLGRAKGAFSYIQNVTTTGGHSHNRITYYKNGEAFFPAMIEGLKQAKEFIFIEFFIISDGQEWDAVKEILIQKAQEGVEVRLVYDDLGCSGTISPRTPKRLGKYGIKCYKFHPFRPFLHGSFNNRDHRKIVVIDHQMAFTGGINLADEYANVIERFGYWKDTMIKIEGSAISNLITIFLQNYDLCTKEPSDYHKYLDFEYPKFRDSGFIVPFGDGPGGIDDALVGEQNYINILNYATKRVDISTPYLIPTFKLLDALRNAALRGVEVNLIVPGIPDKKVVYLMAKSNFRFLLDAGVNIYIYTPGFNHMKSAIADGELAFVGTINYDFRSLVHHFECGATLYDNPCLKDIQKDFDEMIAVSKKVNKEFKLGFFPRLLCALLKLFAPLL